MEKFIIVTSLFFNKLGNQSLLETVKYYLKTYNVIIITAASRNDKYYYNMTEIEKKLFGNLTVIYVYQVIPNFLRFIRKGVMFIKKNLMPKKTVEPISIELINLRYSILNVFSFAVASLFLYHKLCQITKYDKKGIICAYEINAVEPVIRHRKYSKYSYNYKYMAKFQGTVLGFDYKNIEEKKIKKIYYEDIKAFKKAKCFDLCAITNDGSNGIDVLKYFGVDEKRIVSFPNGVSEGIKKIKPIIEKKVLSNEHISLFTLSRLVGWKRVYLSIDIMNVLINNYKDKRFILNIYGYGTHDEIEFLNSKIKKYQLSKYVFIRGAINQEKILDVYNQNDVMLSLYKYTNVTNPVIEAIYLNIPLVVIKDKNLDLLLENVEVSRVATFAEISENSLINEIADFLHTSNFIFEKNNIIEDCFSWENRLSLELELLQAL
jgi:glycosyltransferase involved in cell wall biosynthesis